MRILGRLRQGLGGAGALAGPSLRPRNGPWQACLKGIDDGDDPNAKLAGLANHNPGDVQMPALLPGVARRFSRPNPYFVRHWLDESASGRRPEWEPLAVSHQLVLWVKYHLDGAPLGGEVRQALAQMARSVAAQAAAEVRAVEALAAGKALLFAGCLFAGAKADWWLALGGRLVTAHTAAVLFVDGGHRSRDPRLHALLLGDLLDLVNLGAAYPGLAPSFAAPAGRMMGWLHKLTHAGGVVSFSPGSCDGAECDTSALAGYAGRLGLAIPPLRLMDSGFLRLERGPDVVVIDATGTLGIDAARQASCGAGAEFRVRGALRVDGLGIAEAHGGGVPVFEQQSNHSSFAEVSHAGFRRLPASVRIHRRVEMRDAGFAVADRFEGEGMHEVELLFRGAESSRLRLDGRFRVRAGQPLPRQGDSPAPRDEIIAAGWYGELPAQFETLIGAS